MTRRSTLLLATLGVAAALILTGLRTRPPAGRPAPDAEGGTAGPDELLVWPVRSYRRCPARPHAVGRQGVTSGPAAPAGRTVG